MLGFSVSQVQGLALSKPPCPMSTPQLAQSSAIKTTVRGTTVAVLTQSRQRCLVVVVHVVSHPAPDSFLLESVAYANCCYDMFRTCCVTGAHVCMCVSVM